MPQYMNSMRELSSFGNFETAIEKLYREMLQQIDARDGNVAAPLIVDATPHDYQYSNILKDRGAGRISSGLKSLDLLSILCSGATPGNLFLFDGVIYSGSVSQIRSATDTELTDIVIINLGMDIIVAALSASSTQAFRDECLTIGKDVKVGSFDITSHNKYILAESKRLTNMYIRDQQ